MRISFSLSMLCIGFQFSRKDAKAQRKKELLETFWIAELFAAAFLELIIFLELPVESLPELDAALLVFRRLEFAAVLRSFVDRLIEIISNQDAGERFVVNVFV